MGDGKPVKIRYLRGGEHLPGDGTWLVAVNTPGHGCELIVSRGRDCPPVSIRTDVPLEDALRHAAEVAAEYGVDTIYVLGVPDA